MEKLNKIPVTPEEKAEILTAEMERWIKGMMEATAGQVKAWDVVNEAISGGPWGQRYDLQHAATGSGDQSNKFYWQDYLGDNFVRIPVKYARQYFTENGARSRETIYYLSSVEKDEASYYAMRIRAHWGIENKLHWHLDVTFQEDMCRVRAKNGAVNFSAMRKYALEMLKKQNDKLSLKRRRKKCMWSTEYLYKVFKDS